MTMDEFLQRVAWPGAQPFLDREGEGPTTQVPQQAQDASFEATIPEPFTFHNEAGEAPVRQKEADTPARSLEATSEPPTPRVDPSSP